MWTGDWRAACTTTVCWSSRFRAAAAYVGEPVYQLPYEGAKPMLFVENMDDRAWLAGLLRTMRDELPEPKKKR